MSELLEVTGLSKSFGGVRALDHVQFRLRAGEVHALMGENGAGKSTFMKILMGLLTPDAGEVLLEGQPLRGQNVHEVLRRGIAMIHQEILAVPELTVAQNMFLGREKDVAAGRWGWVNDRKINQLAAQLLDQLGLDIAPTTPMKYLSVAQMQMVEIAKALSNHAKVLIMDEPTSALSDREVGTLFQIIKDLKRQGVAIIYISHKMDEIFAIADTITVLRDGTYIGTRPAAELDQSTLITMMVGREIDNLFPASTAHRGEEVLAVRNLTRTVYFTDVSFEVHRGEVLGLAGLMGAGRTELARAIFGLDRADSGEIYLKGQKVRIGSPREAIRRGIGYVSEDRKALGFVPGLSVQQNLTLASLQKHARAGWVRDESERTAAAAMISNLRIKTSGPGQKVTYLSGGNQQKVVLGKVLLASPELIILDEPTRGVDIGAKFEIYKLINQLAASGLAVILISSELPEILGLSDRVLVLSKGRPTALLTRAEATQETIMQYAMQH